MFFIKSIIQATIDLVIFFKWFIIGASAGYLIWLKIASMCVSLGL